ncbi:Uncharacterized protein FWK35_00027372 [Aphis craccivora]|uniref:Uncharacterized protein n=1 Tax=Aphis craccivora TaxID=307492 RepID=A0A6G0ZHP8_APHCR|nr:Uncharacterized protein FWK35_00027372 [Aphis craccivora]
MRVFDIQSSEGPLVFHYSDSEWSDVLILQCCVFFVSVYMRTCRNNGSIFNFSSFSGSKVNLVGALGGHFFEIPRPG